jgi:hypothetical protein
MQQLSFISKTQLLNKYLFWLKASVGDITPVAFAFAFISSSFCRTVARCLLSKGFQRFYMTMLKYSLCLLFDNAASDNGREGFCTVKAVVQCWRTKGKVIFP